MKVIFCIFCLLQFPFPFNASPTSTPSSSDDVNEVLPFMDLRVGKFVKVTKPADLLDYHVGQVDFGGEDRNVTVLPGPMGRDVSVKTYENGSFVFVYNTTAVYIKGYMSHARMLVAEDWYHTEPVRAPNGARPGDYVSVQGYEPVFKRVPISYDQFFDVRRLIEREMVVNETFTWNGSPLVCNGEELRTKIINAENGYLILK